MTVRAELRALLEEQVRAAEEAYERAVRAYEDARTALSDSFDDLSAYRRALEAATRGTDAPYRLPHMEHPLHRGLAEGKPEPEPKPTPVTPTPKERPPTKKGIILDTISSANGRGLKMEEVYKAIPADAPIKITMADLYRALPRLVSEEKVWKDAEKRYHAGQPQTDADTVQQFFGGLNEE